MSVRKENNLYTLIFANINYNTYTGHQEEEEKSHWQLSDELHPSSLSEYLS